MTALAPTLQAFFTERLARQKNASPHTVAAYRDALRMLVQFAARRIGTPPARLQIEDVDAQLVGAFLDHLEHRPRQQRSQPQHPPGRDPLTVRLRRVIGSFR